MKYRHLAAEYPLAGILRSRNASFGRMTDEETEFLDATDARRRLRRARDDSPGSAAAKARASRCPLWPQLRMRRKAFSRRCCRRLTRAGLITSRRGQSGGFPDFAARPQASMREVIEAVDGPVCLNVAWSPARSCTAKARCPAHPVWVQAQQAMLRGAFEATIAELADTLAARRATGGRKLFHVACRQTAAK